jgi:hypothetical protein
MHRTSYVLYIPASNDVLLLIEIFTNPCHFAGGGSLPETILLQADCCACPPRISLYVERDSVPHSVGLNDALACRCPIDARISSLASGDNR